MTTRDTRDEQLSDEERRFADKCVVCGGKLGMHGPYYMPHSKDDCVRVLKDEIKTLREERNQARRAVVEMARAQDEGLHVMEGVRNSEVVAIFEEKLTVERGRAEKAERALAELVDVVANRSLDSEQVHSVFIRARDLVKEGEDV